jgi:hypothetical protein
MKTTHDLSFNVSLIWFISSLARGVLNTAGKPFKYIVTHFMTYYKYILVSNIHVQVEMSQGYTVHYRECGQDWHTNFCASGILTASLVPCRSRWECLLQSWWREGDDSPAQKMLNEVATKSSLHYWYSAPTHILQLIEDRSVILDTAGVNDS